LIAKFDVWPSISIDLFSLHLFDDPPLSSKPVIFSIFFLSAAANLIAKSEVWPSILGFLTLFFRFFLKDALLAVDGLESLEIMRFGFVRGLSDLTPIVASFLRSASANLTARSDVNETECFLIFGLPFLKGLC